MDKLPGLIGVFVLEACFLWTYFRCNRVDVLEKEYDRASESRRTKAREPQDPQDDAAYLRGREAYVRASLRFFRRTLPFSVIWFIVMIFIIMAGQ